MELAIFGLTGRTGGALAELARARGHRVRALVRPPLARVAPDAADILVPGNLRDPAAVAEALAGAEAVFWAVGHARAGETPEVLPIGMAALVRAMAGAGVRRLVAVSVAGILPAAPGAASLRRDAPGYPPAFRAGSAAHLEAFRIAAAAGLAATWLCCPELTAGPAGPLVVAPEALPEGPKRVAIASVAALALRLLETGAHEGERLGLIDA